MSQTGIDTPSDFLKSLFYTSLLNRHLVEFVYPVTLAGSKYRLSIRPSAFRLSVFGWTDVQHGLIDQVLAETRRFEPAEADFDTLMEESLCKQRNKLQRRRPQEGGRSGDSVRYFSRVADFPHPFGVTGSTVRRWMTDDEQNRADAFI